MRRRTRCETAVAWSSKDADQQRLIAAVRAVTPLHPRIESHRGAAALEVLA